MVHTCDERPLPLGRVKERVLLAMLALRANTLLSKDLIRTGLWDGEPPRSAPANVASYVSNFRRLLQNGGRRGVALETRAGGYLLVADPDTVDVLDFERLLAEGRQAHAGGQYALAVERLTQAAGLAGAPHGRAPRAGRRAPGCHAAGGPPLPMSSPC